MTILKRYYFSISTIMKLSSHSKREVNYSKEELLNGLLIDNKYMKIYLFLIENLYFSVRNFINV